MTTLPSPGEVLGAVSSTFTSLVHASKDPLPVINDKAKALFLVIVGDQDHGGKGDGKVDVTAHSAMRVPLLGWLTISVTRNVPAEEAVAVAQSLAAALPQPAAGFIAVVLGFIRVVVGNWRM